MSASSLPWADWAVGFGSLVLVPLLGVLCMTKRRIYPLVLWSVVVWGLAGLAVRAGLVSRGGQDRLALLSAGWVERAWLPGLFLGLALILVVWFKERRRANARGIRLVLALLTIAACARGLWAFVAHCVLPELAGR